MFGTSLQLTDDNGYIFTGGEGTSYWFPMGDLLLFRTDENGDSLWCVVYGDSAYHDRGKDVLQSTDGGYVVVGFTESHGAGGSDVWIIKTEPDVGIEERPIVRPVGKQENLCATIFHGPLQLPEDKRYKVFDIVGRTVEPTKITTGIYFIEVDGVLIQKVVKVR